MAAQDKGTLIERIRKILAKTEEAGCTPEESEKAFAVASRLMAEHNLTMDEVERSEGGEQSWLTDDVYETGRWSLEDSLAWGIVHEYFFVEGFFAWKYEGTGRPKKLLRFFGRADNVQTAKWTFNALIDSFDRLFSEYRRRTGAPASDRRIYISGVAAGFRSKIEDERRAMEAERDIVRGKSSGTTALALRDIRQQTVASYKEHHPDCFNKKGERRQGRSNFADLTGNRSAFDDGVAAGRSLNLNRPIGSSGQRRSIEGS